VSPDGRFLASVPVAGEAAEVRAVCLACCVRHPAVAMAEVVSTDPPTRAVEPVTLEGLAAQALQLADQGS
jgi:hypothetical protein